MDTNDCLKNLDSVSGVEDLGEKVVNGRYGVTIFFDDQIVAADFKTAVLNEYTKP